jgi:hypothetical protein
VPQYRLAHPLEFGIDAVLGVAVAQPPAKPNVSIEFEKLVIVDEEAWR